MEEYEVRYFHRYEEREIRAQPDFHPVEKYARMAPTCDEEIGCNDLVRFVPAANQ